MSKEKKIWFQVSNNTTPGIVEKVFQLSYTTIYLDVDHLKKIEMVKFPKRIDFAIFLRSSKDMEKLEKFPAIKEKTSYFICSELSVLEELKEKNGDKISIGLFVNIVDRQTLDWTVENALKADIVLIDFKDPTNIPLELVLATTQSTNTRIFKKVKSSDDGEVSFLTMEKGSDGILLQNDNINEIITLNEAYEKANVTKHDLYPAVVTKIAHAGMGDRVCVDTTSELFEDEGMILGSTSSGGVMVCSETHYLPYMNLRSFRVNAGGLHSYVWGPDNKVVYLSDLRAGDKVLVFNKNGSARTVTVGRLKIERRPLFLIEAEINKKKVNVFIQDDWHVRVFGSNGEIRPSSEVKIGDKLLGFVDEPGRHVGLKINETIKEF